MNLKTALSLFHYKRIPNAEKLKSDRKILLLQFHPDKHLDETEYYTDLTQQLNNAFEIINDEVLNAGPKKEKTEKTKKTEKPDKTKVPPPNPEPEVNQNKNLKPAKNKNRNRKRKKKQKHNNNNNQNKKML
jgi:hypothetical protein